MKQMINNNKKFMGMTAAAIAVVGLASCSNDLSEADINNGGNLPNIDGISLVKAPDVVAWSGNTILGNGRNVSVPGVYGTNVNGNLWYQEWDTPQNISDEEIAKVLELVKDPIYKENTIKIDYSNYWVQQVYKGQSSYTDGAGNSGIVGSDKMDHLLAYNENASMTVWDSEVGDWGANVTIHYEHINNFNYGNNETEYTEDANGTNPGAVYIGTTLMTGMDSANIDAQHQFAYHNSVDSKYHYEYIIVEVDGSYYVCFDFYATHPKGQEANKNMDVERDHIYNDWIVKISPAFAKGTSPENPNKPSGPSEEDKENPDKDDDSEVTENPVYHNNEVEVNYAILDTHDYEIADLVTKLSIHVRHATNVDIKIPVPIEYLIESDDLYIFKEHYISGENGGFTADLENFVENVNTSVTYTFGNNEVTLYVQFEPGDLRYGEAFGGGYIHVFTTGITPEVIEECWAENGDGINFEIYNYFQTQKVVWNEDDEMNIISASDLNRRTLLRAMNQAIIEFENEPNYYINAFGYDYYNGSPTEEIHPAHATVTPLESEGYNEPYTSEHLNGTPYNEIYVHSSVTDIDDLHKVED